MSWIFVKSFPSQSLTISNCWYTGLVNLKCLCMPDFIEINFRGVLIAPPMIFSYTAIDHPENWINVVPTNVVVIFYLVK